MNSGCTPAYNEETRRLMREAEDLRRIAEGAESGDFGAAIRARAKAAVENGEKDTGKLIDTVHKYINQYAEHTKSEVADAISGYGKETKPNHDPVREQLNAMKAEMRELSRIQDELTGKVEPDAKAKQARTTSLRNQLIELQRKLDYNDRTVAEKRRGLTNPEIAELKAKRDALQQEIDDSTNPPPAIYPKDLNEVKNKAQHTALKNAIADLDVRIEKRDVAGPAKHQFKPDAETERLKAERKAKAKELDQMQNPPPANRPIDPRIKRNEMRMRQIEKRMKEAERILASGNRDRPAPRERIPYNTEVQRAQTALNRKIAALEEFYAKGERMKRSGPQKVYSTIRDTFMASILASFKVYGKLAGAVGAGHVSSLIADATRTAAKTLIPGVRGVAKQAPRYGVGINPRALAARAKGAAEAPREAYNQMKYGQAAMESAYGKINKMSDEYFTFAGTLKDAWQTPGLMNKISETARTVSSYVGRTHAAEKEFLVQPERRETEYRVSEHLAKSLKEQGLSQEEAQHYMSQETVQAAIGARAVERGYDAKMQGKNALNSGIDANISIWQHSKSAGANFAAFLFNMVEPVRKIGMNIADRQLHNLGGAGYALREAMGKDKMTPERADYIMENIGRQGVGATLLTIGALYYTKFGGVPGVFSKKDSPKKKDEAGNLLKPGESEWVGTEAFHSAEFGLLQIGASMADVYNKEYGRKKGWQLAIDTFLNPVGNWFIRTIPYTDTARRWAATAYRGRGEKEGLPGTLSEIGGNMAGGFIPGAVRNVAQWTDERPGYYRPRNFAEQIEQGVPYLNQNVPKRP